MLFLFVNFVIQNNAVSESLISSVGGYLGIYGCNITQNKVQQSIVYAVMNSHLNFHKNTTFFNNVAKDYIVFIDSDSYLDMNANSHGWNNTLIEKKDTCANGIFMELDDGSYCRYKNGLCIGSCCTFGNTTCDDYTYGYKNSTSSNGKENPSVSSANTIPLTSKSSTSTSTLSTSNDGISSKSNKGNQAGWVVGIIIVCTALIVVWMLVFTVMIHRHNKKRQEQPTELDINDSTVEFS